MIAAGQQVCLGNISDGLPLYVAGPVPCDARHTVPYRPPWGASSYTAPAAPQDAEAAPKQAEGESWIRRFFRSVLDR